jgi:hypothetical protein
MHATISKKKQFPDFFFVIKMEIERTLPLPKLMHENDQRDRVLLYSSLSLVRMKTFPSDVIATLVSATVTIAVECDRRSRLLAAPGRLVYTAIVKCFS